MTIEPESELVASALRGDEGALVRLLLSHSDRLSRRLQRRLELNPFADFGIDDLLQEIFLDVVRGFSSFEADRADAFTAWLDRICDNRLAKTLRDRSRTKRGGPVWQSDLNDDSARQLLGDLVDDNSPTGSEHAVSQEAKRAIQLSIAALPETQQKAIVDYYLRQVDLTNIAAQMQITENAVRSLLYRAKQSLRQLLGDSSRWLS